MDGEKTAVEESVAGRGALEWGTGSMSQGGFIGKSPLVTEAKEVLEAGAVEGIAELCGDG